MEHIEELKKQGLTVSEIATLTGFDRKTIRKYLAEPGRIPEYRPRPKPASKLEPHKAYITERLDAGVWNAVVLMRELRERGYGGGYTILKDYLRPLREASRTVAVRRFETPPGKHYGESGVMVRTRRRSAFGARAATHGPLLGAT